MQLGNHADVIASAFVDWNNRLHTKLNVLTRPDYPGIDRPGRLSTCATVQRSFQNELDQWNQTIEWRVPVHVLHLRLKVWDAVFQRTSPFQHVLTPFEIAFPFAGRLVDCDPACAGARW